MAASPRTLLDFLPLWYDQLQQWSLSGRLSAAAREALQLDGDPQALQDLVSQWSVGNFQSFPEIVLLSNTDINGALGAYAQSTGKIYLNDDWLATATQEQVNAVLTEELGHHLDGLLNAVDTPGDEGEYFSDLLRGVLFTDAQKAVLRTGSDSGTITFDGKTYGVELAATLDIIAPQIDSVVFEKYTFNPDGNDSIKITARIQDSLAGIMGGLAIPPNPPTFTFQSGDKIRQISLTRTTGNDNNGAYEGVFRLPRYEGGDWKLVGIQVGDSAGNITSYSRREGAPAWDTIPYAALGLSGPIVLSSNTGTLDTIAPQIDSVVFEKYTFNPDGNDSIKITARIQDSLAGIMGGLAIPPNPPTFTFQSGDKIRQISLIRTTGNDNNGAYEGVFRLPRYEGGDWKLVGIQVGDSAGNITSYSRREGAPAWDTIPYAALGLSGPIVLSSNTGTLDTIAPQIDSVVFEKYTFNPDGNDSIKITARIQDSLAGIMGGLAIPPNPPTFTFQSGDKIRQISLTRTTGNDNNGAYEGVFRLPRYEGGDWKLVGIQVGDSAGNITSYSRREGAPAWDTIPYAALGLSGPIVLSSLDQSNYAPTDITASTSTFDENIAPNTAVAIFSTTDPDAGDTFTYSLVSGTGSTDNSAFTISGDKLLINTSPNFEAKSSYSIRVRTTDQGGLYTEKVLTLGVNDVKEAIRGNSIYTLVDGATWSLAEAKSVALGGHLVLINNQAENQFITDSFSASYPDITYIGLTDAATESIWLLADGGTASYFNWAPGEPSNNFSNVEEDVAAIYLRSQDYGRIGVWNDVPDNGYENISKGIAEIPLTLSITRTGEVKEGSGVFTTSINLSAGTQASGNLADGSQVWWKVTGITADDLALNSDSLTGSGIITNGKLDIQHSLKIDIDSGENFEVSVYSDALMTSEYQIDTKSSIGVQEAYNANANLWTDPSGILSGVITGTAGDDVYRANFIKDLVLVDNSGNNYVFVDNDRGDYGYGFAIANSKLQFLGTGFTGIYVNKRNSGYYGFHISNEIAIGDGGSDIQINLTGGFVYQNNILNAATISAGQGADNLQVSLDSQTGYMDWFYGMFAGSISLGGGNDNFSMMFHTSMLDASGNQLTYQIIDRNPYTTAILGGLVDLGSGDDKATIDSLAVGIQSTQLVAGEGNDDISITSRLVAVNGSNIDLGQGDDRLIVVASNQDQYALAYSTVFTGIGNDYVELNSVRSSTIDMGEGIDTLKILGNRNDYVLQSLDAYQVSIGKRDDALFSLLAKGVEHILFNEDNVANSTPIGKPTLSGIFRVGQTISIDASAIQDADNFTGYTPTYSYSWEISGNSGGTWTPITTSDAADGNNTYTLVAGDVGKQIRGAVRYLDGHGTYEVIATDKSTVVTYPSVNYDQNNNLIITAPGAGTIDGIPFTNTYSIDLGASTDTATLTSAAGTNTGMTVAGGIGTDTLNGNEGNNILILTGENQGTLDGLAFTGFENVNLGAGNDIVYILPGGSLTGLLNGGGTKKIVYLPPGVPVPPPGGVITPPTTPPITPPIALPPPPDGFDIDGGYNAIYLNDNANSITLTGAGSGIVDGTNFTNFYSVDLRGGNDTALIQNGGSLAGLLDGGNGTDTLNLNSGVNALSINSALSGTAAGTTIAGFESINLDGGDDTAEFIFNDISTQVVAPRQSLTIDGGLGTDSLVLNLTPSEVAYLKVQGTFSALKSFLANPVGQSLTVALSSVDLTLTGFENGRFSNNEPYGINLTPSAVDENLPTTTVASTLSTSDDDSGDTFTYSFATGAGDTDNGSFTLLGDKLFFQASPNYEFKSSYTIRLQTTDAGGLSFQQSVTLNINNLQEGPGTASPITSSTPTVFTEGVTLSAGTISGDPDGNGTITAYQWYFNDGVISGETSATYKTSAIGFGTYKVALTYTDGKGDPATLTSAGQPVTKIDNGQGTLSAITANGALTEGVTLTAGTISDDPDGNGTPASYQWLRNGTAIGGATSASYLVPTTGAGAYTVQVSYRDGQDYLTTLTSTATVVTAPPPATDLTPPTISSISTQGTTVILKFSEAISALPVSITAFAVSTLDSKNKATSRTISTVARDLNDPTKLILTLTGTAPAPNVNLRVSYTDPAGAQSTGDVQDLAGNDLASFSNRYADTFITSSTTTLASQYLNLVLTGTTAINGTGNANNNIITGNSAKNVLVGGAGADTLTGSTGADTFRFALADSRLAAFDRITDFAIGTDILDGPIAVTAVNLKDNVGTINGGALTAAAIQSVLTTTTFVRNGASTFTWVDGTTTRTFLALNDATAGFQAASDGLIEITGVDRALLGNLAVV